MKKFLLSVFVMSVLISPFSQAQTTDKAPFPPVNWESKNTTDAVSIQNGAGIPILIVINVNKDGPGVNVKNCGTTTHIDAGSSTICSTNDKNNPVTLNSDSSTQAVNGTYQIKQP